MRTTIYQLEQYHNYLKNAPEKVTEYDIEHVIAVYKEFFSRLPFQIGKEVVLLVTPEINEKENWGWMGAKHWLKAGVTGVIKEIDFYKGKVRLGIEFYNQTYIYNGEEIPLKQPYTYTFSEDSVALLERRK